VAADTNISNRFIMDQKNIIHLESLFVHNIRSKKDQKEKDTAMNRSSLLVNRVLFFKNTKIESNSAISAAGTWE